MEIPRENCAEQKSRGQTVPSRNPEGKLSWSEIQRANCPDRKSWGQTVPSGNPEGKLSRAEIPRANCPEQKSHGQTVQKGNPEAKLSQAEILRANCPEPKSKGQTVLSGNPKGKPSGLLLGISDWENHSGNCPKCSECSGIVWIFCTKKWWGVKTEIFPLGLLLGICPQDYCLGFALRITTWENRSGCSGNCPKHLEHLGIVWTFVWTFALRSDGEQKTEICPQDYCLEFVLGITALENHSGCSGNCPKYSEHLGIVWTFVWTFCTKKWWGAKNWNFPTGLLLGIFPWEFHLGKLLGMLRKLSQALGTLGNCLNFCLNFLH